MPSSCINEFDASIALSEALQALEATYPDPPSSSKPSDVAVVRALRGGAIVLMVATLEQFMRSAIEEHLQPFTSGKTQRLLSSLPTDLQVASAFNSLELAMRGPRYGKNGSRGSRLPDVMIAAKRLAADSLDVSAFSVTGGNPRRTFSKELGSSAVSPSQLTRRSRRMLQHSDIATKVVPVLPATLPPLLQT
jgi:hypothetical protein